MSEATFRSLSCCQKKSGAKIDRPKLHSTYLRETFSEEQPSISVTGTCIGNDIHSHGGCEAKDDVNLSVGVGAVEMGDGDGSERGGDIDVKGVLWL